ncbi:MAG TPA: chemotaxis protein CheW [Polyangiaceae bacterium]|nr:chemotaxis protein CheW [Polyangiaceae bacterium]
MSSSRSETHAQASQSQRTAEYLTFFIAGVEYAVSLDYVREVIPYDTVTRVPGMPSTVRGVTNLRGSVVPVIDLAIKFRLPAIEVTSRTCIVLVDAQVGGNSLLLGLLTEEVGQVLAVDVKELLPPPAFGTPIHNDYLAYMLPIAKKFALVLDIQRTLSQDELLSTVTASGEETATEANGDGDDAAAPEVVDDAGWEAPDAAHAQE